MVRLNTWEKTPRPVLVWGCCREPLLLLKCSVGLLWRQRPLSKRQVWIPTAAAAAQQIPGITPASVGSRRLRQQRRCRGGSSGRGVQETCGVSVTLSQPFFFDTVVSIFYCRTTTLGFHELLSVLLLSVLHCNDVHAWIIWP